MLFEFSDKARDLQEQLKAFMNKHIYPNEPEGCGTCFCRKVSMEPG